MTAARLARISQGSIPSVWRQEVIQIQDMCGVGRGHCTHSLNKLQAHMGQNWHGTPELRCAINRTSYCTNA